MVNAWANDVPDEERFVKDGLPRVADEGNDGLLGAGRGGHQEKRAASTSASRANPGSPAGAQQ